MAHLVVSYPTISKSHYEWIQNYREENDKRYFSLIDPHFTLVFASDNISEHEFIEEAEKQVADVQKIAFEIKVATINQDDSGQFYHEFLVPDRGYSDVVKLHDRLYSGKFFEHLRFDIDFIPHIGIGNSDDTLASKKRVDMLNTKGINIPGSLDSIDIIEFKESRIRTVRKLHLRE